MTSYYAFSTIPRAFDFLTKQPKTPIQPNRNLVQLQISSPKASQPSSEYYAEVSPVKSPQPKDYNKAIFGDSSRRTLVPDLNEDNPKTPSKKITRQDNSPEPGNWNTLIGRTDSCQKMWQNKKVVKGHSLYVETVEPPKTRTALKSGPLKVKYDYTSQISSLPIGKMIRESDKVVPHRNYSFSEKKLYNDFTSSIQTLPGPLKSRHDGGRQSIATGPIDKLSRNLLTTEEQTHLLGPRLERTSPKKARKNELSTNNLDEMGRLHLCYRPASMSEAKKRALDRSPEPVEISPVKVGKARVPSAKNQLMSTIGFGWDTTPKQR